MQIQLKKTNRQINGLIWHCTATPELRWTTVAEIRAWHKARGWDDIGYHYVVMLDGTVMEGRPVSIVGAHVEGHNTGTIGCVYVGGIDKDKFRPKDTRTVKQKAAMLELTKALAALYPGLTRISGHNEWAQKACPSFRVPPDALGNIPGFKRGRKLKGA
jgi:N-acetylmuramoyl-L-alanine amidase